MNLPKGNNRRKRWNMIGFVKGIFSVFLSYGLVSVIGLFARNSSFCNLIVPYSISVTDSDGHEHGYGNPLIVIMWVVLYSHVMNVMQD